MNTCKICQLKKDTFTLEVPYIEDTEVLAIDEYHICGSCWEIIAGVANRRLQDDLHILKNEIEGLKHEIELINCTLRGPIDD